MNHMMNTASGWQRAGLWIGLLLASLAACNFRAPRGFETPPTPTPIIFPTDTAEPPTQSPPTETLPTITETPVQATVPAEPATVTTAPTAPADTGTGGGPTQAPLAAGRLQMAAGSTSAFASGSLPAGGRKLYLARARAGQTLLAAVDSAGQAAVLEVVAPGGTILLAASDGKASFQGLLPLDGDYQITVVSGGAASGFTLSVTIPVRVTFRPGKSAVTLDGTLSARGVNSYLLNAQKGQTLTVTLHAKRNEIFLAISGLQDGQAYLKTKKSLQTFSLTLPATQDYLVQTVSVGNAQEKYTLDIEVK